MATVSNSLQDEIQQANPFRTKREELALSVLRTADQLRALIGSVLQPFGLTMQQYNVLRILRGAGERGIPTLAITDRMIERAPGITRLLDRMEHHGWACRSRCTKDRRVVYATITTQGLQLLNQIEQPLERATDKAVPEFSDDDLHRLLHLLACMRQATVTASVPDSFEPIGAK